MNETIQRAPLAELAESPFNPRRTFNEAKLLELAASIKQQGVMQPIVVRDRWGGEPQAWPRFEIIFGHRRARACRLAELTSAPVVVRDMTDEEVKVAQLHENAEREDVNAVEEAEAFDRLMKDHGITAEQLIERTGKSKSHIYGRLKLLQLCPEVREACASLGLPVDVAVAIGRLKGATTQRRALERVRQRTWVAGDWQDMGWVSVRAAKRELEALQVTIPLIQAPFNPEDATLHAQGRVCSNCPSLSDNDPDTLDAYGAGVCTEIECFNERKAQHFNNALAAHQAAGGRALTGDDAAKAMPGIGWPLSYTCASRTHASLGVRLADDLTIGQALDQAREKLGDKTPTLILMAAQPGVEPVPTLSLDDLRPICEALDLALPVGAGGNPPQRTAAQAQEGGADGQTSLPLPLTEEEQAVERGWDEILRAVMRKAVKGKRTTDELRMVVDAMLELMEEVPPALAEVMGWEADLAAVGEMWGDDVEWVHAQLPTMSADALGGLVVALALCQGPLARLHETRAELFASRAALAKSYGVNPLDPEAAQAEPLPPQSPAAQAQEGGAEGSEKPSSKKPKKSRGTKPASAGRAGAPGAAGEQSDLVDQMVGAGVAGGSAKSEA